MRHIDTLIYAGWVIPGEPEGLVLEQHALAIHDGLVLDILPSDEAARSYSARITHRLAGHALIPGLINAHTHAPMTLLRGLAPDVPLMDWLHKHIWPAEQRWVSPAFVADGTRLAIAEMLLGGVTCFNDMYFFPDVVANVAAEAVMRACVGLILVDFPTIWAKDLAAYLAQAERVYETYRDHALISTMFSPHAPYSVSDASLQALLQRAEAYQLPIHMHVQETAAEVQHSLEQHGVRPLARLQRLGILERPLLAVHATQLDDEDLACLHANHAHVIHCPESNLELASGFCPVQRLLEAAVNVALGTDGAASNDGLDMLGEMRSAALLAKGVSGNASAVPAARALRMATLNGAAALGIAHLTGSLVAGKAADVAAIDMRALATQPVYHVLSQIVYAASREQVTEVWVAGRHLVKSRSLTSIDIHALHAQTHQWWSRINGAAATA